MTEQNAFSDLSEKWVRATLECEQTILRFTAHFDAGEYLGMERYFAVDGVWKRHEGDIRGVGELRERMAARESDRLMRHIITNMRTTFVAEDRALVDSYVTLFMHVHGGDPQAPAPLEAPQVVGRYRDELVRVDGAWRIALRHPIHDFKRSN